MWAQTNTASAEQVREMIKCNELLICEERLREAESRMQQAQLLAEQANISKQALQLQLEIEAWKQEVLRLLLARTENERVEERRAARLKIAGQNTQFEIIRNNALFPGYGYYRNGQRLRGLSWGVGFFLTLLLDVYSYARTQELRKTYEQTPAFNEFERRQTASLYTDASRQSNALSGFTVLLYFLNLTDAMFYDGSVAKSERIWAIRFFGLGEPKASVSYSIPF